MIRVTRLNGSKLYVNADMIRFVEATPDTVISLVDDVKIVVRETPEAIVDDVVAYRQRVHGSRLVNREDA
ncbi:MAG: flagellar FlbD family protein [Chloroflexi bacterium]|nr:flagellar FlbD family protein [Chloroflexota bacterium]